jgi:hypothetical protein
MPAPTLITDTEVVLTREAYDAALERLDALAAAVEEAVGPSHGAALLAGIGEVEDALGR